MLAVAASHGLHEPGSDSVVKRQSEIGCDTQSKRNVVSVCVEELVSIGIRISHRSYGRHNELTTYRYANRKCDRVAIMFPTKHVCRLVINKLDTGL